jgi:L,D-transpeptidase catalytic domain
VAVVLVGAAAATLAVRALGHEPHRSVGIDVSGLPSAPALGLPVGAPVPLHDRGLTRWQAVRRDTTARATPSPGARAVGRLPALTPEGTTNVVLPRRVARDAGGGLWVRVALPVLPNGTEGWVPRAALGAAGSISTHLVVDRRRFSLVLVRGGRVALRARIGVGMPGAPTPRGRFVVRDKLTRYRSAFYGPVAFGTSARSPTLTDWPAGGFVGIHGTDRPDLIPGRISHGCIRMRNADIVRLARLMPVGTPITIR